MPEKIITIKQATKKTKGDTEWIEIIDGEGKTHRVFSSVQDNEGNWHHFEKDFDMLLNSVGKAVKLTKEKKGNFWNVIGLELVENVFVQQAQRDVEDTRSLSIEQQVIIKALTELWIADKLKGDDPLILALRVWCAERLGMLQVEKIKTAQPETRQELPPTATATPAIVTVKNAGDLMRWALSHGKEFNASFVRLEANIPPNVIITQEMAQQAYVTLKSAMEWD